MFRSPFADGIVILVILLLFVGPKRLPMLSRSIGESIREFKGGINHSAEPSEISPSSDASGETTEAAADSTKQRA